MSYSKYYLYKHQETYDNGVTWVDVTPSETVPSGNPIATYDTLLECEAHDYSLEYLTFVAEESGRFSFTPTYGSTNVINYSLDDGLSWNTLDTARGDSVVVSSGDTVMWKSRGTSSMWYTHGLGTFYSTNRFHVQGNIMSLVFSDDFIVGTYQLVPYEFHSLFKDCTHLTSAENLVLPAATLAYGCFTAMFKGCTSLTTAPSVLPATTLTEICYSNMFQDCSSLTTAPILPATTLARACYNIMFAGCTSLTVAPELPAETLADSCYNSMFYGCSSLNYIKCVAIDISASGCTNNWVNGVASAGTFIRDCDTEWSSGNNGIPNGWNVRCDYSSQYLTFVAEEDGTFGFRPLDAMNTVEYSTDGGSTWSWLGAGTTGITEYTPTISAGTNVLWKGTIFEFNDGIGIFSSTGRFHVEGNAHSLLWGDNFSGQTSLSGKDYAFTKLFSGCTTLTSAENMILPATTLAYSCYANMFQRCTSLTTAPQLLATTLAERCYYYMFNGCTSLTTAPQLPATTLADVCYVGMFENCTSLTTPPVLSATTLRGSCYGEMFAGCTSLTTAPTLPATTLADWCYAYMFYGCTSLTTAPVLSATTLVYGCYVWMFDGCTSLNSITCLATDISAYQCTENWVENVASSGTFTKAANMSGWGSCGASKIPCGWTVVDAT